MRGFYRRKLGHFRGSQFSESLQKRRIDTKGIEIPFKVLLCSNYLRHISSKTKIIFFSSSHFICFLSLLLYILLILPRFRRHFILVIKSTSPNSISNTKNYFIYRPKSNTLPFFWMPSYFFLGFSIIFPSKREKTFWHIMTKKEKVRNAFHF